MNLRSQQIRARVIQGVKTRNITTDNRGHRRWWLDAFNSRPLTQAERNHLTSLVNQGHVRWVMAPGYKYTRRGYYEFTVQGMHALCLR